MEEDLYRIYETEALGYDPFVMVYNRHLLPEGIYTRNCKDGVVINLYIEHVKNLMNIYEKGDLTQ